MTHILCSLGTCFLRVITRFCYRSVHFPFFFLFEWFSQSDLDLTVCVSCFTASHAWLGDSGIQGFMPVVKHKNLQMDPNGTPKSTNLLNEGFREGFGRSLPPLCLWLRPEMRREHPFWRNTSIPWTCKVRMCPARCPPGLGPMVALNVGIWFVWGMDKPKVTNLSNYGNYVDICRLINCKGFNP